MPSNPRLDRNNYKIFSEGAIAGLALSNRLIRSATWDPYILTTRQVTEEVLDLYRNLALGGVGAIITGGLPVYRERIPEEAPDRPVRLYSDLRINGLEKMAEVVHQARSDCKIIAQLEVGYMDAGPSSIATPFSNEPVRKLTPGEIEQIVACFVAAITDIRSSGFDGVQLHAAHGGLLSWFLSPYTNRRADDFGGSPEKRSKILGEIVAGARQQVGEFPILIKMKCTDYLAGGVDMENFPALAQEIARAGMDAIEISGGMWECLLRSEKELGFRPVPAPESHTRIVKPEQQSYFLPYAEKLDVPIPLILVGGNRDIERLEAILQSGKVDFIALCRPLIREPDLPNHWRAPANVLRNVCPATHASMRCTFIRAKLNQVWLPVSVKQIKSNIKKPRSGLPPGEKTKGEANAESTICTETEIKNMGTKPKNSLNLPVKVKLPIIYAASLLIATLMTAASFAGFRYSSYIYPTEELVQAFIPNDVVNLLIGLPILLGPMWLAWRGRLVCLLCWMGALFFILYNYTAYVFAMPMSWAFLVHLSLVMLSVYSLIGLVANVDGEAVQERLAGSVPEKFAGGVLAGLGLLFFLRAIGVLVSSFNRDGALAETELAVNIADFLITPAWIIGGILLWRRKQFDYVTSLGLLFQGSMLFIALIIFLLLKPLLTTAPFALTDVIVIFVMGLIFFIPFVLFLRGAAGTHTSTE